MVNADNANNARGLSDVHRAFIARQRFTLDAFQNEACASLEKDKNVLVAAPTGAGKTLIASFAVFLTVHASRGKVFYTTPIKALSNQKFHEFCEEYGQEKVGLLTGDTSVNPHAPIVVMTTEVLRNMVYNESDMLDDLRFVVLDEVHYLADRFRGAVWEEVILHVPPSARLVALSATVSNVEEFGAWLRAVRGPTDVIVSEDRPVPLGQHVLVEDRLYELFDSHGTQPHAVNPAILDAVRPIRPTGGSGSTRMEHQGVPVDRQHRGRRRHYGNIDEHSQPRRASRLRIIRMFEERHLLPAIFFIFKRTSCDDAVTRLVRSDVWLTTEEEAEQISSIVMKRCETLSAADRDTLEFDAWLEGLQRGLAAHHAGLLPLFKGIVEELFVMKLIRVVFATETLALGINMPARTVVLEQLEKFNGVSRVPISAGEYTQLTGRAGRRGIDVEGHSIVQWRSGVNPRSLAALASRGSFPLTSQFRPSYNMAVNLIESFGFDHAQSILERSFAQFQADRATRNMVSKEDHTARGKTREHKRLGALTRRFCQITALLHECDYLQTHPSGEKTLTDKGRTLRGIYGERDLLIAECIEQKIWNNLDSAALAAIIGSVIYTPKRSHDNGRPQVPRAVRSAFHHTVEIWHSLDEKERGQGLSGSEPLSLGMSSALHHWARGVSFGVALDEVGGEPGDFVRQTKRTMDVLNQLSLIAPAPLSLHARKAREQLNRGIVALSVLL